MQQISRIATEADLFGYVTSQKQTFVKMEVVIPEFRKQVEYGPKKFIKP